MTTISTSSSGISTGGIDVNTLVTQLVAAERAPQDQILSTKQSNVQADVSAWGTILSSLSSMQGNLSTLMDPTQLQALTASSSNSSVLTATTGTGAQAGNYAVLVNQLAQSSKLASAAYADATATGVGTGTLTLSSSGNTFSVNIASGSDSLTDIANAINSASGNTSVTASIIQATDGAHLMLASNATGAASQISVSVGTGASDTGNLAALSYTPGGSGSGLTQKVAAQDAQVTVDGFTYASASNTMNNVIPGLNLNLASASAGTPVTVTVAQNNSSIVSAVQALVTSYNSLDGQIRLQSGYNSTTQVAGPLSGDSLVRNLASQLTNTFMGNVSGADPGVNNLLALGISIDKNGTMSLDTSKLQSVLNSSPGSVTKLLSGPTGLATQINSLIQTYNNYGTGLISDRQTSLQSQLQDIQQQQTDLNTRMQAETARYTAQFSALNTMLSSLQSTSNYLTANLAKLL